MNFNCKIGDELASSLHQMCEFKQKQYSRCVRHAGKCYARDKSTGYAFNDIFECWLTD